MLRIINIALTIVYVASFSVQTIRAEQAESFNKVDMAYAFGESIVIDERSVLSQREMADTEGILFRNHLLSFPKLFVKLYELGKAAIFGPPSHLQPYGPATSNINFKLPRDVLLRMQNVHIFMILNC